MECGMVTTGQQALEIATKARRGLAAIYGDRLRGVYLYGSGELDERLYKDLRAAFERRQQVDYEAILEVDRQAATQLYRQAINFVDACRRLTL